MCFASHTSFALARLGPHKDCHFGANHVLALIEGLGPAIRRNQALFRFSIQVTLPSNHAIGRLKLLAPIVSGGSPFLLSNMLMRALEAEINCIKE